MSYTEEEIGSLMNDLAEIGMSHKVLVYRTHFGFGQDLQGENDGKTLMYITREGMEMLVQAEFATKVIPEGTYFSISCSIISHLIEIEEDWKSFPVPFASSADSDSPLLRVGLFQSSPRMHFPGEISPEKVRESYELLWNKIREIKLEEG